MMPYVQTVLARAAAAYDERGITVVPLGLDEDGLPKRPLDETYPRFRPADNSRHDWSEAKGLGLVLGKPSGGLAVIDVDDLGLAEYLQRQLLKEPKPPLMSTTARGKLHVFVQEERPSGSCDLEVHYSDRLALVQLLAAVSQVAAPPTPGYEWVDPIPQPLYGSIGRVWNKIALQYSLPYREARPWSFMRRERSRGPTTGQIRQAQR